MSVCSSCGKPVRRTDPGKEGRPTDDHVPRVYKRTDPFSGKPVMMVRRLCSSCKGIMGQEGWKIIEGNQAGSDPAH